MEGEPFKVGGKHCVVYNHHDHVLLKQSQLVQQTSVHMYIFRLSYDINSGVIIHYLVAGPLRLQKQFNTPDNKAGCLLIVLLMHPKVLPPRH